MEESKRKMAKALAVAAVLIVAIGAIAAWAVLGSNQEIEDVATPAENSEVVDTAPGANNEEAAEDVVEVRITDSGFDPQTVTVAPGTTVRWVNEGGPSRRPASDVHPWHKQLAGFDAQEGISHGESYSYTFNQTGTWKYHDHLNPSVDGTVVVE